MEDREDCRRDIKKENEEEFSLPTKEGRVVTSFRGWWIFGMLCRHKKLLRCLFYPVLGCGLLLFFILFWLATAGLPDYAARKVSEELESRGFGFSAKKLKLSWNLGLQAYGLSFVFDRESQSEFFFDSAILNMDYLGMWRGENIIDSITIRSGSFQWVPSKDSKKEEVLRIDDIAGMMIFDETEKHVWTLKNLSGVFRKTKIQIMGELRNTDVLGKKRLEREKRKHDPEYVRKINRTIHEIFTSFYSFQTDFSPKLILNLNLDAKDLFSSEMTLFFDLEDVRGQYGWGRNFRIELALNEVSENKSLGELTLKVRLGQAESIRFDLSLEKAILETKLQFSKEDIQPHSLHIKGTADWISSSLFNMKNYDLDFSWVSSSLQDTNGMISLKAQMDQFWVFDKGRVDRVELTANIGGDYRYNSSVSKLFPKGYFEEIDWQKAQKIIQHLYFPQEAVVSLNLSRPDTFWGKANQAELKINLIRRSPHDYQNWNDSQYGLWRWITPVEMKMNLDLDQLHLLEPELETEKLALDLQWGAPYFRINKLYSVLYNGEVDFTGNLNIEDRYARGEAVSDCDAHRLAHLLDDHGQRWLSQFGWEPETPPDLSAKAKVRLAEWTNLKPDWKNEVLPQLELEGHLQGTNVNFKGVSALSAEGSFCLTNAIWTLPDFKVVRPEGNIVFYYESDSRTQDYYWDFDSSCNPKDVAPLLGAGADKALQMFEFNSTPHITAKLWGRWRDLTRSGLEARINADNFVFRKLPIDHVQSLVTYTNGFVRAVDSLVTLPPLSRPVPEGDPVPPRVEGQQLRVDEVTYSAEKDQVTITNGVAYLYPGLLTRVIGPVTDEAMRHYHFELPPHLQVNGMIPIKEAEHSFIDFKITQGTDLNWWKIKAENLTGLVRWQGDRLCLTNLNADFYDGNLNGWAQFDFKEKGSSDFQFDARFQDCSLSPFAASFSNNKTNNLDGKLSGQLLILSANTADWDSWRGYSSVSITNGLIWDIPLFGIFSDMLNSLSPGLGNSRADQGGGTFRITNSVIWTDDMLIATPTFQIHYQGSIDFDRNLDAQVDIDILRRWGSIGKVINFVTLPVRRIFRCNVRGVLEAPEIELTYIPKPVMMILRPVKTLRDVFHFNKEDDENDVSEESGISEENNAVEEVGINRE